MVNISKALNAAQVQTYHQRDYVSSSQSYYSQEGGIKGEWQGKLAEKLGLSGEVKAEDFKALSEGNNPLTGEVMVKHRVAMEYTNPDGSVTKAVEHRAGWDATFSAPKSISITALVGGDMRIVQGHREAVTEALTAMQPYTQARMGGNNAAQTTGNFIVAKFEHDTARPVDGYAAPQLHTHAIIFNVTEKHDGKTRALQERALFDSQAYATAVYQSALTYKLRDLGYEIERGKSGAPEIKGYTQEYLDASSLRSQQIKAHMAAQGYSGPAAAQVAAHATRGKKQDLSQADVLQAHQQMAAVYGNQPNRVLSEARVRIELQPSRPQPNPAAREAVTYARDHIYEREAVADERHIMVTALRRGMAKASFREVREEFIARRNQGHFFSLESLKHDTGQRFTTPETLAAEKRNIRDVLDGREALKPIMNERDAMRQAASRELLNDSQRRVIIEILSSSDRIQGLQGLAGTGKTSVLDTIRDGAEKTGYKVEGFAPTSRAAGQLRDAGVEANTLQSFLTKKTAPATQPRLYILDESSLTSTMQMRFFLNRLAPEDRVLVIGDTRQHQGVEAGRPFQQMQEAGMRTSKLDKIMRQKDPELLKAVQHLAIGETAQGVALLTAQGRVTEVKDAVDRVRAIAKDYVSQPQNTIIVSPDNRSRQAINEAVRSDLIRAGVVAEAGKRFEVLLQRSELTGAGRTWAALYRPNDIVQYSVGSPAIGLKRGSSAVVRAVDEKTNAVTVEQPDGTLVTYDPRRLRGVNVFEERSREFAAGDRIQFTALNKSLNLSNRDLGTVTAISSKDITVALDGRTPRTIVFDGSKFQHFDHGYAVTSHSSQGLTTGRVLANIDTQSGRTLINTRLAYVAISRASHDARIYTNDATTLGERLAQSVTKTAAVEFPQPASPAVAPTRQPIQKTPPVPKQYAQPAHNAAVQAFRDNDSSKGEELLTAAGRVHTHETWKERIAAVVSEYTSKSDRAVILSSDKADRKRLTHLIRDELKASGHLAPEGSIVSILVKQEISNSKIAANYAPGDVIQYKTGSPEAHGIPDGSTAVVKDIDATRNLLMVERAGETVSYNPALLKKQTGQSTVYAPENRELSPGDRIQFTKALLDLQIREGSFATIVKVQPDGGLSAKLDSRKSVHLDPDQAKHIDYGYAVPSGKTASLDRVILTADNHDLSRHYEKLSHLSPKLDVSIHTAAAGPKVQIEPESQNHAVEAQNHHVERPEAPAVDIPSPSVEIEGFSVGF